MKRSIPIAQAPKTIRDAVYITQLLKVRYLWIDALCIVQDDEDEWLEEGGRMADIYSGATLVISAASTADCTDGFLEGHLFADPKWQSIIPHLPNTTRKSRTMVNIESFLFRTPTWNKSEWESLPPLWVRRATSRTHAEAGIAFPISKRAWISQELSFARRILCFTQNEMFFQCYNGLQCECGSSEQSNLAPKTFLHDISLEEQLLRNIKTANDADELFRAWRFLVSIYSTKRTHSERDKLLALSSTARVFARYVEAMTPQSARYLAGIWASDLVRSLCWQAYAKSFFNPMDLDIFSVERCPLEPLYVEVLPKETRRQTGGALRRASFTPTDYITPPEAERLQSILDEHEIKATGLTRQGSWPLSSHHIHPWSSVEIAEVLNYPYENSHTSTYVAPTWSWASLQLPVTYPMEFEYILRRGLPLTDSFVSEIEVLEADCCASAVNPTGPVTSGHIKLTGMLAPIRIRVARNIPIHMYDTLGLSDRHGPMSRLRPGNSFLVLRSVGGHIGFARTDGAMHPDADTALDTYKCWLGTSNCGVRCFDEQCDCKAHFREQDYYMLKIGTSRRQLLPGSGRIELYTCYLVLHDVAEGVNSAVETFERIGVLFHFRLGSDLSRLAVFEDAERRTIRIQ